MSSDYLVEPFAEHWGDILDLAILAQVKFSSPDAALLDRMVKSPVNEYPNAGPRVVHVRDHFSGGILGDFFVQTYAEEAGSTPIHPAFLFTLIARMRQEHWRQLTYRSLISPFLLADPDTVDTYCVYVFTPDSGWEACERQGKLVKTTEWIPRACYAFGYEAGSRQEPFRYDFKADGLYGEYVTHLKK